MKKLIFACSALLIACVSMGSDLSDFREAVVAAETQEELQTAFDSAPESISADQSYTTYFNKTIEQTLDDRDYRDYEWEDIKQWALEDVDGRLAKESGVLDGDVENPQDTAAEILSNPIYVDIEDNDKRNWVGDMGSRFSNWLSAWLESLFPDNIDSPSGMGSFNPFGALIGGAKFVMWAVVILAVGIVLYFVLRNFSGVGRKVRVGGILEDDEPLLTADQWLVQADQLQSEGKFREAVRCLYLACLVRFDDGGIARFRRHETNWEHLYRIEGSPQTPKEIDFRHTTQRFDKIWYGHVVKGASDVQEFKEVYQKICLTLGIKKAA